MARPPHVNDYSGGSSRLFSPLLPYLVDAASPAPFLLEDPAAVHGDDRRGMRRQQAPQTARPVRDVSFKESGENSRLHRNVDKSHRSSARRSVSRHVNVERSIPNEPVVPLTQTVAYVQRLEDEVRLLQADNTELSALLLRSAFHSDIRMLVSAEIQHRTQLCGLEAVELAHIMRGSHSRAMKLLHSSLRRAERARSRSSSEVRFLDNHLTSHNDDSMHTLLPAAAAANHRKVEVEDPEKVIISQQQYLNQRLTEMTASITSSMKSLIESTTEESVQAKAAAAKPLLLPQHQVKVLPPPGSQRSIGISCAPQTVARATFTDNTSRNVATDTAHLMPATTGRSSSPIQSVVAESVLLSSQARARSLTQLTDRFHIWWDGFFTLASEFLSKKISSIIEPAYTLVEEVVKERADVASRRRPSPSVTSRGTSPLPFSLGPIPGAVTTPTSVSSTSPTTPSVFIPPSLRSAQDHKVVMLSRPKVILHTYSELQKEAQGVGARPSAIASPAPEEAATEATPTVTTTTLVKETPMAITAAATASKAEVAAAPAEESQPSLPSSPFPGFTGATLSAIPSDRTHSTESGGATSLVVADSKLAEARGRLISLLPDLSKASNSVQLSIRTFEASATSSSSSEGLKATVADVPTHMPAIKTVLAREDEVSSDDEQSPTPDAQRKRKKRHRSAPTTDTNPSSKAVHPTLNVSDVKRQGAQQIPELQGGDAGSVESSDVSITPSLSQRTSPVKLGAPHRSSPLDDDDVSLTLSASNASIPSKEEVKAPAAVKRRSSFDD